MPGISFLDAISLKQIRHNPKSLIYPLFRPHLKQRRTIRVEYLGVFFALAMTDSLAMLEIKNVNVKMTIQNQ